MADNSWRAAVGLAVGQCGVVRRDQLYELGITKRALRHRLDDGTWIRHGRRVLMLAGTAENLLTDSLIVAHSLFPDATLTGSSALAVHGLLDADPWKSIDHEPRPWIRVADHRRARARVIRVEPGSTSALPRARLMHGVPVVSVDAAAADLLRFLPYDDARALAFELARERGSAETVRLVDQAAAELGRAAGARQLRGLVELLADGAHSEAEQLLVVLLRDAGIEGFVTNYPVVLGGRRFRIDVAFRDRGLAIEVDGQAFHSSGRAFQHDRTRQNLLVAAGWRVLRFTWEDLTSRPERVLSQIVELLES